MPKLRTRPAMLLVAFLFCTVMASSAQSTFFTSLVSFDGTDGAFPTAALVQASDGNFYGTTSGDNCSYGCGTVFKLTSAGTLTTLYSFCSQPNCSDGATPVAGLVQGSDGNFYGTTLDGGAYCLPQGCGTVFKITPEGTLTTLYNFCSAPNCTDGYNPEGVLVQAADGNFYGTTWGGGASHFGLGTVFKITPEGSLTTLHSFQGYPTEGARPYAGVVEASDGNFYGTTDLGGAYCGPGGCGAVFKITPTGTLSTVYSFCAQSGCFDGALPVAALVQASDGNFYGTTQDGGTGRCGGQFGCGTVFRITSNGLTTLHRFDGSDDARPEAPLVEAADGNFYGTTIGNPYYLGSVFKITPAGMLTTLHRFDLTDGAIVFAGLVQGSDGAFYGTTYGGGAYGYGTIYTLGLVRPCATCRP